jgi:predicted GIY-YIG superfamily endonuclease
MFYVYIIRSINYPSKLYTGYTKDLKKRLLSHNRKESAYTAQHAPWQVVYYAAFADKCAALSFESYLKTASGIAFRNKRLL